MVAMAKTVPGAYVTTDSSWVRYGVITGLGSPGTVMSPSKSVWLKSMTRQRSDAVGVSVRCSDTVLVYAGGGAVRSPCGSVTV